jgi:SAM-dependent methyltransferase
METYSPFRLDDPSALEVLDELPLWSAPFGLRLLDAIPMKRRQTVLDIGSGTGFPILELAMRMGESTTLFGIDPWKEGLDRIRRKAQILGITNIRLMHGYAEAIPLADASVDLIVSNNGINNVQDPAAVFSECGRIAGRGSSFIFAVNLEGSFSEFYDTLQEALEEKGLDDALVKMKEHIYDKRKPVDFLLSRLKDNGFDALRITRDVFRFRYTDADAMFRHFFIRLAFLESWKAVIPSPSVESILDSVRDRLNLIAEGDGQLVMTVPFVVIEAVKD